MTKSITFCGFMSDVNLEETSSVSHNSRVDEVQRLVKPGSVAKKREFFETKIKQGVDVKPEALLQHADATRESVAEEGSDTSLQEANGKDEVKSVENFGPSDDTSNHQTNSATEELVKESQVKSDKDAQLPDPTSETQDESNKEEDKIPSPTAETEIEDGKSDQQISSPTSETQDESNKDEEQIPSPTSETQDESNKDEEQIPSPTAETEIEDDKGDQQIPSPTSEIENQSVIVDPQIPTPTAQTKTEGETDLDKVENSDFGTETTDDVCNEPMKEGGGEEVEKFSRYAYDPDRYTYDQPHHLQNSEVGKCVKVTKLVEHSGFSKENAGKIGGGEEAKKETDDKLNSFKEMDEKKRRQNFGLQRLVTKPINDGIFVALNCTKLAENKMKGITCETAEEFYGSLVNPLSERSLWTECSPRGLTCSVSDGVVSKEKFYFGLSEMLSKKQEGLEVFLQQDHNYGKETTSVIRKKKTWTMMVDASSLLDSKSRKTLQLLQGLKGTQLIIPLTVLRELYDLKYRGGLFRTNTEASLSLEWIRECKLKNNWWIHLESSMDEEDRLAPTSRLYTNMLGKSLTSECQLLKYALHYRKMHTEQQFIFLSNELTVKIKAMADDITCETAQEFRDSLVNPFSERFLWTESSARGLTWSVSDDAVLKENFYAGSSKKLLKEGGLKLISDYGKETTSETEIYNEDKTKTWTMIVDTSSLLDSRSRKALQLLQGLKGTQLIIPLTVLRELYELKRCGGILRRNTEASLSLEWIKDCMLRTDRWIHLESSLEEEDRLAAPSRLYINMLGKPPTSEDLLLEYALHYRKMHTEQQLVFLSNEVTSTIKAMDEGVTCETAQEFRNSLVNPFSERFLWTESSPRGQTWSVSDDVVLKEIFYSGYSKKPFKGEADGLKLISLWDSNYENIRQPFNAFYILTKRFVASSSFLRS